MTLDANIKVMFFLVRLRGFFGYVYTYPVKQITQLLTKRYTNATKHDREMGQNTNDDFCHKCTNRNVKCIQHRLMY